MFEQRLATDEDARRPRGLWVPEGFTESEIQETDWYVVVDDLFDEMAVCAHTRWPRLDAAGRLYFSTDAGDVSRSFAVTAETLLQHVSARRLERSADPEVSTRPLRIGDAFLVRGAEAEGEFPESPEDWAHVADVTAQARTAAKTALYGAVAPRVTEREAAELALVRADDDERPPDPPATGPTAAAPAV